MALYTVDALNAVSSCLAVAGPDDVILLLGDAVDWRGMVPATSPALVALDEDLALSQLPMPPYLESASYLDWVTLTERHSQHVHWR